MLASTLFAWSQFMKGSDPKPLMIVGVIGLPVLSIIMSLKKQLSPILAPFHALIMGLFVGSVSAAYDYYFQTKYPGIVMQAVGLTLVVAVVMFVLYYTRIIKVTEKFKSVIIIATTSIMIFYMIQWISSLVFNYQIGSLYQCKYSFGNWFFCCSGLPCGIEPLT